MKPNCRGWPQVTYFILAERCRLIKIGTTGDPHSRYQSLCAQSPDVLVMLGLIPGSIRGERELHDILADYRHHGEWFRATPVVRAFIRQCIAEAAEEWFEAKFGKVARPGYWERVELAKTRKAVLATMALAEAVA